MKALAVTAIISAVPLPVFGEVNSLTLSVPSPIALGTPSVTVSVLGSGGAKINGAELTLFVGDGGPSFGGITSPSTSPHVAVGTMSAPGMVMAGNNTGTDFIPIDVGFGPEPLAGMMTCYVASGALGPVGLVATFTLDTSAALPGHYLLHLDPDRTAYGGSPANLFDTTLIITPEPATLAALALGSIAIIRRRRTLEMIFA